MKSFLQYGIALPVMMAVGLPLGPQFFPTATDGAVSYPNTPTASLPEAQLRSPYPAGEQLLALNRLLGFRLGVRPSRYRIGGFVRGTSCAPGNSVAMTAVVPPTRPEDVQSGQSAGDANLNRYRAIDSTVSPHPTVLVHIPVIPGANSVQFTLQNEDPNQPQLYRTAIQLTNQPGIWGIRIPDSVTLEAGKTYLWQIQAVCSSGSNPYRGPYTSSWIQRVALTDHPTLRGVESLPLSDRPERYAEAGIWLDTLSSLAELRYRTPSSADTNAAWTNVLQSVGLNNLATAPIVQMVGYPNNQVANPPTSRVR